MKIDVSLGEVDSIAIPQAPKEMLSISQRGNKTLVRINSSSLGVIQECLRKSQYLLHRNLVPETESAATLFGSAIHKALEVFYGGTVEERILPPYNDMELLAFGHATPDSLIPRAIYAFAKKAEPLSALPPENKRSISNGVWILWNYFKAYLDDPYIAYVDEFGPFVERGFTFDLYEDENLIIEYFGTIDLVMKHLTTGNLLVCDHKTSSVVGNDFYNRIRPNSQYTGYLMGARGNGINTNDFMVNCLEVKAKPKTARGSAPNFPRQITNRSEEDFAEFRETVIFYVKSYLTAIRTGTWPISHTNACAMYAGCTYLSICGAPKNLRENIINAKFKQRGVEA
jgi:hypothetical protein